MWAAIRGYDSLIVMLLSANADGNLKDKRVSVSICCLCVDVMYEMLCTNNKCINIEYYYNFI